jgi:hypothetical protein
MINSNDGWIVGANGTILHWDGFAWSIVTSPTTCALHSVFMITSNDGWAVGEDIIHWNGSEWSLVTDPLTDGYYFSVFMLSSDEGWAVGRRYPSETRPRTIYYGPNPPIPPPSQVIPDPPVIISLILMVSAFASYYYLRKHKLPLKSQTRFF